jgi:hypothetical protein
MFRRCDSGDGTYFGFDGLSAGVFTWKFSLNSRATFGELISAKGVARAGVTGEQPISCGCVSGFSFSGLGLSIFGLSQLGNTDAVTAKEKNKLSHDRQIP